MPQKANIPQGITKIEKSGFAESKNERPSAL